jgi:hypothetical protein
LEDTKKFQEDYEKRRAAIEAVKAQYKNGWKPDFDHPATAPKGPKTPTPAAAIRTKKAASR